MQQKFFNARELAIYLGVKESTIRTWTRKTDLPRLRAGRSVRFNPEEVERWFRERDQRC
jgi:excisionase family DNA binding protein